MYIKNEVKRAIREHLNLDYTVAIHDFNKSNLGWGYDILSSTKTGIYKMDLSVISPFKLNVGDIFIFSSKNTPNDFVSIITKSKKLNDPDDFYEITITTKNVGLSLEPSDYV